RQVMIISQSVVERFFHGEDPIGHRIDLGDTDDNAKHWREIVGIVGDVRRWGPGEPVRIESYVPLAQHGLDFMSIAARSARPESLLNELPALVASVDPDQSVAARLLMTERVADSIGREHYVAQLLAAFAAAALLLATLGLFGLVSYST